MGTGRTPQCQLKRGEGLVWREGQVGWELCCPSPSACSPPPSAAFQSPDYQSKKLETKTLRNKLFHIKRMVNDYDKLRG